MAKKNWSLVVLVILSTVLLVSCGSTDTEEPQPIEIPASNYNFLLGSWEVWIGEPLILMFEPDGTVRIQDPGGYTIVSGPIRLEGNQLVDMSVSDCEARYDVTIRLEPNAEVPGLHFELVGEDCRADRVEGLAGKTLYPYQPPWQ